MVAQQNPAGSQPTAPNHPDLRLTLGLHMSPQETLPVEARFRFDPDQPFAVCVDFWNIAGGAVTWLISRELLAAGTVRPSGEGDIRVWPPCQRHAGTTLHLLLLGQTRTALLDVEAAPLSAWLAGTFALVSAEAEWESIDWDGAFEHTSEHPNHQETPGHLTSGSRRTPSDHQERDASGEGRIRRRPRDFVFGPPHGITQPADTFSARENPRFANRGSSAA